MTLSNSVGLGGINRRADVEIVQTLINKQVDKLAPLKRLKVDGEVGPATIASIEAFQQRVVGLTKPDGRVDPRGKTLWRLTHPKLHHPPTLTTREAGKTLADWVSVAAKEASWVSFAAAEDGQREVSGYKENNPRIIEYLATFPYLKETWLDKEAQVHHSDADETAWCAAFVNWCLLKAGRSAGPSGRAKEWLTYGVGLEVPVPGAITIIYKKPKVRADRKLTPSGYHVGFYVRGAGASVTLLGGNQGDRVQEQTFIGYTIKGYRWPS